MEDLPKIDDLIRNRGIDVNVDVSMGDTPLVYAIEQGKYNAFQKLLELGADVNKVVPKRGYTDFAENNTPLMIAATQEDPQYTVDLIIDKGANVNARNALGRTALMIAYHKDGVEESIQALLDAGADIEIQDNKGQTVLYYAIERVASYDSIGWLELLFEDGRTPNVNVRDKRLDTPLMFAVIMNRLDAVEFLLTKGADLEIPDQDERTPLFYALENEKDISIVNTLLNAGAETSINVHGYNYHALIYALRVENPEDYSEIVKLLLDKGVDVNVVDESDEGSDDSPLLFAIRNDFDMDIIKRLIEKGANVNYVNAENDSALLEAVYSGEKTELVRFLLDKGASVNMINEEGSTPLIIASVNGYTEIVKLLIEKGANVNIQNNGGDSALISAMVNGRMDIAKLLIESGAEVNVEDVNGMTPLMHAARTDNIELVELLLEKGADKTMEDVGGLRAIDYAHNRRNEDIIELLRGAPQQPSTVDMWKGYTKADAEFFNPILENEKNLNDQSICPFCLQYTERERDCKYMSHKCRSELRHERLYNLYKNKDGYVVWCAVCGRHCYGHGHFPLTDTNETVRPNLIPPKPDANVYDPKSCPLEGGGGPDEKIKRIDGLLRYVCEVQEDVGKRPNKKVREELIEEAWKAASARAPKTVRDIRAAKKFNIPCGLPSAATTEATVEVSTDIPNPNPMPVAKGPGTSSISLDDCDETYEFVHKQPDGSMFTHQLVCKADIREVIRNSGGSEDKCPIEPECKGKLYPDEIKEIFADDVEFYKDYKERFNEKNKVGGTRRKQSRRRTYRNKKFRGGADGTPILSKMTDAICALPEKKTAGRRTYKNKNKPKRSTRRR